MTQALKVLAAAAAFVVIVIVAGWPLATINLVKPTLDDARPGPRSADTGVRVAT